MFKREHHEKIHQVLLALDAEFLRHHYCYFGGGTAIVLRAGEYRESMDIDFLVADIAAYRELRRELQDPQVLGKLLGIGRGPVSTAPEIRADQYGIRTRLPLAGDVIKFEIVFEARIPFDEPSPEDRVAGVSTLTASDLGASKLLANVDRWADAGVFSRDILDLAMLELNPSQWNAARAKAEAAYGGAVFRDARKAIAGLHHNPERLSTCLKALAVDVPAALMLERLKRLEARMPVGRERPASPTES